MHYIMSPSPTKTPLFIMRLLVNSSTRMASLEVEVDGVSSRSSLARPYGLWASFPPKRSRHFSLFVVAKNHQIHIPPFFSFCLQVDLLAILVLSHKDFRFFVLRPRSPEPHITKAQQYHSRYSFPYSLLVDTHK
mgnify:CR=1 FL=1